MRHRGDVGGQHGRHAAIVGSSRAWLFTFFYVVLHVSAGCSDRRCAALGGLRTASESTLVSIHRVTIASVRLTPNLMHACTPTVAALNACFVVSSEYVMNCAYSVDEMRPLYSALESKGDLQVLRYTCM